MPIRRDGQEFSRRKEHFHVSRTVCCFACDVDAGVPGIPRCRRADSPSTHSGGDFFIGAFLSGTQHGLKAGCVWPLLCLIEKAGCPGGDHLCCFWNILSRAKEEQRQAWHGAVAD